VEGREIRIKAKVKSIDQIESLLSTVKGSILIRESPQKLLAAFVEKRDVENKPVEFFAIAFEPEEITIIYNVPNYASPTIRRWNVIRKVIPLLAMVSDYVDLSLSELIDIIEYALRDVIKIIPEDAKQLLVENDRLKREVNNLQAKLSRLEHENMRLSKQVYELNEKVKELQRKLERYETMPKNVLKSKILDWLQVHNGEIDIEEFAKYYGVNEQYVEDTLSEMVKENLIRPV
jgi:uncharacterized protein YoxC